MSLLFFFYGVGPIPEQTSIRHVLRHDTINNTHIAVGNKLFLPVYKMQDMFETISDSIYYNGTRICALESYCGKNSSSSCNHSMQLRQTDIYCSLQF